jgi:hypothetical protein
MPESIELIHEELLSQLEGKKTTSSIRARLMSIAKTVKLYDKSVQDGTPNESLKRSAQNQSAILHQEISNLLTSDLPDEEESPIKIETMPTKEEQEHATRAARVGLEATATVAEIEAKEAHGERAGKVSLPITASVAEIEAEEKRLNEVEEDRKQIAARAKKVGLPETSSQADVEAKEKEIADADELAARAKKAGLPATATLAEVEAKEKETATPPPPGKKEEKKPAVSMDPYDTLTGG